MKPTPLDNQPMTLLAGVSTALLSILFGANAVAIKISLVGIGPFTTAGLRFSMASLSLLLWAWLTKRSLYVPAAHRRPLLLLCIIFTIQLSLLYLGIYRTNASRATLLINLQPFFLLFLAHIFIANDRITFRKIIGIFFGFAGVVFVFMDETGSGDFRSGDVLLLCVAALWGFNSVYSKKIVHNYHPFHLVLYPMIFSIPFFFIEGYFLDHPMISELNAAVLSGLLYQSLVTASFGFVLWMTLLQKYGAVALHSFIFIMPISGVILGGMLLHEPITFKIIIALILIASGILVVHLKQKPQTATLPINKPVN